MTINGLSVRARLAARRLEMAAQKLQREAERVAKAAKVPRKKLWARSLGEIEERMNGGMGR